MKMMKNGIVGILLLATASNLTACKKSDATLCMILLPLFPVAIGCLAASIGWEESAGDTHTRDLLSELENADEAWLETKGQELANRFSLSEEQGLKVARMHRDFALIQDRNDADVEDFSRRLYGVSPREVEAAIEASQLGHGERFNVLIEEGAAHFGTTPETFKVMVKGLYGSALESAGVAL